MPETFTRRNLPHWYVPHAVHFVTYRLAGTIPSSVLANWRTQRKKAIEVSRSAEQPLARAAEIAHKQFFAKYDEYLDKHSSINWLSNESVAEMIRENLYHHDGTKYHLLSYCIMPNHVHVLLQPCGDEPPLRPDNWLADEPPDGQNALAKIMHSLKSYTANRANKLLRRTGQFWQHESYDHWVRDDDELERIMYYINANPVAAGLVEKPHLWKYGSARDRFFQDGEENGMLLPPT